MVLAGSLVLGGNLFGLGTHDEEKIKVKKHAISVLDPGSGFLGVSIREVKKDDVDALSLPDERGAYIHGVEPGTPAEEAGLQEGDVILSVNGHEIDGPGELTRNLEDGENELEFARDQQISSITVKLGEENSESEGSVEM
jgi:S1-C subfamily serine protease